MRTFHIADKCIVCLLVAAAMCLISCGAVPGISESDPHPPLPSKAVAGSAVITPRHLAVSWQQVPIEGNIGPITDIRIDCLQGTPDWTATVCGKFGAVRFTKDLQPRTILYSEPPRDNALAYVVDVDGDGEPEYLQGGGGGGGSACKEVRLFGGDGVLRWRTSLPFDLKGFGGISLIIPISSCPLCDNAFAALCIGQWERYAIVLDALGTTRAKIPWDRVNAYELSIDTTYPVTGDTPILYGAGPNLVARTCDGRVLWRAPTPGNENFVNIVRYSPTLSQIRGESMYYISSAQKNGRSNTYWCAVTPTSPVWRGKTGHPIPSVPFATGMQFPAADTPVFLIQCRSMLHNHKEPLLAAFDQDDNFVGSTNPALLPSRPEPAELMPLSKATLVPETRIVLVPWGSTLWMGVVEGWQ